MMIFLQNLLNRMLIFLAMPPDAGGVMPPAGNGGAMQQVAEEGAGTASVFPMILMWGGMFAALYFFLIRPQRRRDKAQKQMQSELKVGDRVITSSGMYGKIVSVGTDAFMVEFGDVRGVRVPVRRTDVLGVKTPNMSPPGSSTSAASPSSEPMKLEDKENKKEKEGKKDDKNEGKKDKDIF